MSKEEYSNVMQTVDPLRRRPPHVFSSHFLPRAAEERVETATKAEGPLRAVRGSSFQVLGSECWDGLGFHP